jgi:hypothetical protein
VFTPGTAVYLLGYGVFAWEQHQWPILLIGFVLCGLGIGFAETGVATVVARLLPEHLRRNGLGVLGLVQSFGGTSGPPWSPKSSGPCSPPPSHFCTPRLDDPVGLRLGMAASTQSTTRTRQLMTPDQRSIEHHSGRKTMANPCAKAIASMTHPRKVDSDELRNHKCHRPGDP